MDTKHELKTWVCEPAARPAVLPAVLPEDEFLNSNEIETYTDAEDGIILIRIYTDNSVIEIELY